MSENTQGCSSQPYGLVCLPATQLALKCGASPISAALAFITHCSWEQQPAPACNTLCRWLWETKRTKFKAGFQLGGGCPKLLTEEENKARWHMLVLLGIVQCKAIGNEQRKRPGLVPWLLSCQINIRGRPWNNQFMGLIPFHPQTELKYLYKPRHNFYLTFSLGFTLDV